MPTTIDLRSDTVTKPTPEMMAAIARAEVGDDVYGEDPATTELERYAAELMGKEAGLLLPSGTMGNLVAILTHTQRRRPEIIAEFDSHILLYEGGGYAHFGGVSARGLKGSNGALDPAEVESCIRGAGNVHYPVTSLICMENTHNCSGGTVVGLENLAAIKALADKHGIGTHLDGARVFNAAIALGVPAGEIAKHFTSVQFCLSKGLSAPVGTMLVGEKAFIEEARHYRKMLGGGMRQCGIIAAAGLVALRTMVDRLAEDHQNARALAQGLQQIPGVGVDLATVQTNMVRIDTRQMGMEAATLVGRLEPKGILCISMGKYLVRFVTHRHISAADIAATVTAVGEIAAQK